MSPLINLLGKSDKKVFVWDSNTGNTKFTLTLDTEGIVDLVWSPTGLIAGIFAVVLCYVCVLCVCVVYVCCVCVVCCVLCVWGLCVCVCTLSTVDYGFTCSCFRCKGKRSLVGSVLPLFLCFGACQGVYVFLFTSCMRALSVSGG